MRLYPHQLSAIHYLKNPGHLVVISQTGSGKSQIFIEVLKRHSRRMLLVVPLRALAKQHCKNLKELGYRVGINGDPPSDMGNISKPMVWIVSPEKVDTQHKQIASWSPDFLVVDEAHCIYEWGVSFRTAFSRLPEWAHWKTVKRSLCG